MRDDVGRIRALIAEGKSNAEIMEILRVEQEDAGDFLRPTPQRTIKALSATMRHAVREDRAVGASEVLALLGILRVVWEEVEASGDVEKVESGVLHLLREVASAAKAKDALACLSADMTCLAASAQAMIGQQRTERENVEKRYRRHIGSYPVICVARAASAVADAALFVLAELSGENRYQSVLTPAAMQPSAAILVLYRPTWAEMLKGVQIPKSMELKGDRLEPRST